MEASALKALTALSPTAHSARLLVIRAGALGDTILTLPAIRALRQYMPSSHITAVGYPQLWSVAGNLVDEIVSIDDPIFATLFSSQPASQLVQWLTAFDRAVVWTTRDPATALAAAGIPFTHASPYPPPEMHAAVWLTATLGLTLPNDTALPVSLRGGNRGDAVLVHPGAGATWKRWPAERFAALVDHLASHGVDVGLVEGPADREAVAAVLEQVGAQPPIVSAASPVELARVLSAARLVVGNDSGVTHLAAAAGVPTLALFGPTDPAGWAPLGDVCVIRYCRRRATAAAQIRVCDDPECMPRIPLETVLQAVDTFLERSSTTPC
ncbi:MAG TPA: glycosyltransferase family 9 protein [Chloroflexota bacterium]|nr:glycosyltransferase family 9 protein [Chloroflexota bacterium]